VDGLLAARGGSTSHAAVAVHGIDDKPYSAVLGVTELHVSKNEAVLRGSDDEPRFTIHAGDVVSIHGQSGEVYFGTRPIMEIAEGGKPAQEPEAPASAAS